MGYSQHSLIAAPNRFSSFFRRVLSVFTALAVCLVLAVAGLFGALWLEHRRPIELPKPTGSFAVGGTLLDWVDNRTFDLLAPVAGTKRELLVFYGRNLAHESRANS